MTEHILENAPFSYPFIVEGIIKDTSDPQQMGRCRIWCPAIDGEFFEVDRLPWAEYATPFGGTTLDFKAGRGNEAVTGYSSYGLWAIPKIGSNVLVFFLYGDVNRRMYFGATFGLHKNRSMPAGRNKNTQGQTGPWTDTYDKLSPSYENLREQFQGNLDSVQAQTRGAYERQVAQAKTTKDGKEGYSPNIADRTVLDPQVYCLVTPGHHALIMTDDPENCRVRIKTTAGNQIIFDDTNERIYVSTARGGAYFEMDEDGHVYVYGADSMSFRSGGDLNFEADGNVNIEAQKSVNIKAVSGGVSVQAGANINIGAAGSIYETCCDLFEVSGGTLHVSSSSSSHFVSGADTFMTSAHDAHHLVGNDTYSSGLGSYSHFVRGGTADATAGSSAACASPAESPPIIPGHEPWVRPLSTKVKRNNYWRP